MTTTTTTPSATTVPDVTAVIDAMRSIQTESDRWRLAEALHAQVPSGTAGLSEIIDAATDAGVIGKLSFNTLRLYRDTAAYWPADTRIPNVSFSAHRTAQVLDNVRAATKLLNGLAKQNGPGNVTVASVRRAIRVQQGKAPSTSANGTASAAQLRTLDVVNDIKSGAPQLIAAIDASTTSDDLDKLQAGMTKAIAHVEKLRAKAARKATNASKATKTVRTAPTTATPRKTAKATTTRRGAGDLRRR